MKYRVLIADDHFIVREGLRLILETAQDMEYAGEATGGEEAVIKALDLRPDIIIMDMRMPGGDGLSAIERIHEKMPETGIVILTTFNEDELMIRGLRAGARAFLLKDTDRTTLLSTLRAAARGESLLKPAIVSRIVSYSEKNSIPEIRLPGQVLSDREREVLSAAATGERSKEIAYRLHISERTVKAHLSSIFQKLGVDSRTAAVTEAIRRGLLRGDR